MGGNQTIKGRLCAVLTITIWGTTFISTKLMLAYFRPIEILFFRFIIGLFTLAIIYPHRLRETSKQQELTFAVAGLCGVTLYYLLENIALLFTSASNVGVIISVAPFFTAIFATLLSEGERPNRNFFLGFVVSIIGIFLISFNGVSMELNPFGDLLALAAAVIWALYSILSRKISQFGYPTVQTTRRIFFYGLLFMIPVIVFSDFEFGINRFSQPKVISNMFFLGIGASALCFVTWNLAVKQLGAVKTSVYIYAVPLITVITSVVVLQEKITGLAALGIALTLTGLLLSEKRKGIK